MNAKYDDNRRKRKQHSNGGSERKQRPVFDQGEILFFKINNHITIMLYITIIKAIKSHYYKRH